MHRSVSILTILLFLLLASPALSEEGGFTQEDRQRLRELEINVAKIDEGLKATNVRISDVNLRIDELRSDFKADNQTLRDSFNTDNQTLRDSFKADNQTLRDSFKAEMQAMRDSFKIEIQALREEIAAQRDYSKAENQAIRGEIKALRDLVYVVISGIFILISFVLWDRRTTLNPIIRKHKELEERDDRLEEKENRIERALKEMATQNPDVAKALKSVGLI